MLLSAGELAPLQVPLAVDLAAVVFGALAGLGVAIRTRLDIAGGLALAVVMGLGGGILRDLLLGLRPIAMTNPAYLTTVAVTAVAASLLSGALRRAVRRASAVLMVLDSMSMGLFTIVGVEKALLYDLPAISAVFIGACAAVGGSVLADVIAGRPVAVVRQGPWNATAAILGGTAYVVCDSLGNVPGLSEAVTFAVVVASRLASFAWGLQTPLAEDLGQLLVPRRHTDPVDPPSDEG